MSRLSLRARVAPHRCLGYSFLLAALFAMPCCGGLRTVALFGDAAPGTAFLYDDFSAPVLNNGGEVAFHGFIDDDLLSEGIWSEGDGVGVLRKVVLLEDVAPGAGGAIFDSIIDPESNLQFNNLGDVAFVAELDDGLGGIFTDRDRPTAALTKIALDDDPAPGLTVPKDFQFGFSLHAMGGGHSGTAFVGNLTSASHAVFSEGTSGTLGKIVEITENAPGTAGQFTVLRSPSINDSGHIAFSAETNAGAGGVWSNSPSGTLRNVALAGQAAPGTSTTFSQVFGNLAPAFDSLPVVNNDGDVAFIASLTGLIGGSVRAGIWVERDGTIAKVVVESETAPGTGSTFQSLVSDPLIDGNGLPAFLADLADGRDGLWKETSPGTLQTIAVEGQAAPETELNFLNILEFSVNASGQVAFLSQLSDGGTDAIFATDPTGSLRKIAAIGDTIDVGGVMGEIDFVDFQGAVGSLEFGGGATNNGFNDSGLVAFLASGFLLDGSEDFFSGVFISDIASMGGVPGDYNGNGIVDAADYTVWLDALGGSSLLNDPTPGTVDQSDYAFWKANFGATSGTSSSANVPEPASWVMLLIGLLATLRKRVSNQCVSKQSRLQTMRFSCKRLEYCSGFCSIGSCFLGSLGFGVVQSVAKRGEFRLVLRLAWRAVCCVAARLIKKDGIPSCAQSEYASNPCAA